MGRRPGSKNKPKGVKMSINLNSPTAINSNNQSLMEDETLKIDEEINKVILGNTAVSKLLYDSSLLLKKEYS